jgi:hypothetical protein
LRAGGWGLRDGPAGLSEPRNGILWFVREQLDVVEQPTGFSEGFGRIDPNRQSHRAVHRASSRWCSDLISPALIMSRSTVPSASPPSFGERVKRRVKFAAGSVEPKWREVKLGAKVAGKAPKSRSDKSRAAWRNDPKRDEKILSYIGRLVRKRQPVRLSVNSTHSVSAARKNLADATRAGVGTIPDLFVPTWDHSSDLMKMLGWGLAARNMGATPFTLRISEEVIGAAKRSRVGPSRYLQDRIARHLRTRFPNSTPTFWFAIEQGFREQAHLHGAILIEDGQEAGIRKALVVAGGDWAGGTVRQVHFSPKKNQIKWVTYSTKWLFGTHRRLVENEGVVDVDLLTSRKVPIAASQTFRVAARAAYRAARTDSLVIYP